MRTIDDIISQNKEKAESYRVSARLYSPSVGIVTDESLIAQAEDCEQLADLLEELKQRREHDKKGKWVWDEEWVESTTEHPAECNWAGWICSNCRQFPDEKNEGAWDEPDTPPKFNFCPHCGADMRGE